MKREQLHSQLEGAWSQHIDTMTLTKYPLLPQLFERQAGQTPVATAVVGHGQHLTYAELNRRANVVAHHLLDLGISSETIVGVCLGRSPDLVAVLLGILKAGCAYLPLDPAYPSERLAFMLRDSHAAFVITDHTHNSHDTCPAGTRQLLVEACLKHEDESNVGALAAPTDLAYVIYTSGSTGNPKGVAIEQRNAAAFLHWVREAFSDDELAGVLAATSICFDLSIFELFGPLCWGGSAILASDALHGGSTGVWDRVTLINTVPSVMQVLLRSVPRPAALRTVNLAGEPLKAKLVDALYQQWRVQRVNDLYGPTETTTYSTWATRVPGGPVTIGQPITNTQVYVVDDTMSQVPAGRVGELLIGGAGVTRGYLHRPELTAERFLRDPFSNDPEARVYRTGDLVRWSTDGTKTLEYLGRRDQQVKLRGFRIELGEIEMALETHADVSASALVVQGADSGEPYLVAYLILRDGTVTSAQELRTWLGRKLPEHMLPARFISVAALPLTPNGKVDRQALVQCNGQELIAHADFAPPTTHLERTLEAIWKDVLRLDRVSVDDSFFLLGGHSLLAQVVVARISEALQRDVPLRWIYETPTIRCLAMRMATIPKTQDTTVKIPRADRQQPLWASFGQHHMWLLTQSLPNAAVYNEPIAFRFAGAVDEQLLFACLTQLQQRHETLRTVLVHEGDALFQRILPSHEVSVPLKSVDWRNLAASEVETHLRAEVRRPFDLAQSPLWRVLWARLSSQERMLVVTFHHSIVDEWSLTLFCRELAEIYAADGDVEAAGLTDLPIEYADFAAWEKELLTGPMIKRQRMYWQVQLAGLPPTLELPSDFPHPACPSGEGEVHRFQLSEGLVTGLRRLATEAGVSIFTLVLAIYQVWLYRYSGQLDVVVSSPFAHRHRPEVQSLLGFFLNTIPLRVKMDPAKRFCDILASVKQTVLGGLENSDIPFEQLVQLAANGRVCGQNILSQAMFMLLEEGIGPWSLKSAYAEEVHCHTGTSKCDLTLSVMASGAEWTCELEFATDMFLPRTAERMATHWEALVRSIVTNPNELVGRLNILPVAERRQILETWNATSVDYPRDQCLHQLIETQVMHNSGAPALTFGQHSLTYDELNRRANSLARKLRQCGVTSESTVGVCLKRSPDVIIAILAVLKAGGAYVPLDPTYPLDRIAFILSDSQAKVVLTDHECLRDIAPRQCVFLNVEELHADQSDHNLDLAMSSRQLAYVMYTSGSTGLPKGVGIEHRSVVNFVKAMQAEPGISPADCILATTSINFDISVLELLLPLAIGGRIVMASDIERINADAVHTLINAHGVTVVQGTPSYWRLLLAANHPRYPHLKVLCGGESLPAELARNLTSCFDEVWNMYGPTETTIWSTVSRVERDSSISIGRPIANTQVYVLDEALQIVPPLVTGELYIGGDGVARGYLNRSDLTAERFVRSPFSADPDARLYCTGDMVRWSANGTIEYLGRRDQQVKLRGFRIELGEVEAVLDTHSDIAASAVLVQSDTAGEQHLVAYLVMRDGAHPTTTDFRNWLARKLPNQMIPTQFVPIESLPLTPNRKIDRQALQSRQPSICAVTNHGVPPSNELQRRIAAIWSRLFGHDKFGTRDDFFELGGHSLLAVKMLADIKRELDCEITLGTLLSNSSIERLADAIERRSVPKSGASAELLQPMGNKSPIVFMPSLSGIAMNWNNLLDHWSPDRPVYTLTWHGNDVPWSHHATLTDIAKIYIDCFHELPLQIPVNLVGHSFGGTLAVEVAHQLREIGARVDTIVAMDAGPGRLPQHLRISPFRVAGAFSANLLPWLEDKMFDTSFSQLTSDFWRKSQSAKQLVRRMLGLSTGNANTVDSAFDTRGLPESYIRRLQTTYTALQSYIARPYFGRVVVIRASVSPLLHSFVADLGWGQVAPGRVKVVSVPGNHTSMLAASNSRLLAQAIQQAIDSE